MSFQRENQVLLENFEKREAVSCMAEESSVESYKTIG